AAQRPSRRVRRVASAQRRGGSGLHFRGPGHGDCHGGNARVVADASGVASASMSGRAGGRWVWGAVALALVLHEMLAQRAALAQGAFQMRPLLTTAQLYDSNLFFTKTDRQSDLITRISPGLLSEYWSPRLALRSRYTLDLERFTDHPELSGMDARQ